MWQERLDASVSAAVQSATAAEKLKGEVGAEERLANERTAFLGQVSFWLIIDTFGFILIRPRLGRGIASTAKTPRCC